MYKPLPDGLTIRESNVQGLGLFATKDFDADVVLGIVHVLNKNFPVVLGRPWVPSTIIQMNQIVKMSLVSGTNYQ